MAAGQKQKSMKALIWKGDWIEILNQRELPDKVEMIQAKRLDDVIDAIRTLKVRGAPLLGVVAAYGLALQARNLEREGKGGESLVESLRVAIERLLETRPTAVNLRNTLRRMEKVIEANEKGEIVKKLEEEAVRIEEEEENRSLLISSTGVEILPQDASVLTICNTGALAAPGFGTAFGILRKGFADGRVKDVFVMETRPLLQGARLTMWEMKKSGISAVLVTDSMAASLMQTKKVNIVIVGADRIARNGDTANKIGTLGLAVLARFFEIPFFVVAPLSTFDLGAGSGEDIPIEERDPEEVLNILGNRIAPRGTRTLNYAFDITPASLITGIVTEKGVLYPPFERSIQESTLGEGI